jgi:hypothetical protein
MNSNMYLHESPACAGYSSGNSKKGVWWTVFPLKADSHIACRAHAVTLIHTCHAAPLSCSDSAVSFVQVRVVAGNIRTASPTV